MRPKKNLDKDLSLNRGLHFVIGLAFVLLLIYIALEWKTTIATNGFDLD